MSITNTYNSHILIIDDHPIYLDGLEMLLSMSLETAKIHKASNLDDVTKLLKSDIQIDLILLDLHLNQMNGFELCQLELFNDQAVAILSASENVQDIQQAKTIGLLGYLNKGCDNQKLIDDVRMLLNGECVFPNIQPSVMLTPRQQDVLNLLAQGYPNKTICNQLKLSEATVKTHLRALFSILDVHTRTQCVSVARDKNLI
jgi:DNA-binding NarL/FixJ family response regulator